MTCRSVLQRTGLQNTRFPEYDSEVGVRGEGEARSLNGIGSSCAHVGAGRWPDGARRRVGVLRASVRPSTCTDRKSRRGPAAAKTRGKRNELESSK